MTYKEEICRLVAAGDLDKASSLLSEKTDDAWSLYMLGRIAWKKGQKSTAITLYERAIALDSSSEAVIALEQAREIMNFYNTDLYNP